MKCEEHKLYRIPEFIFPGHKWSRSTRDDNMISVLKKR